MKMANTRCPPNFLKTTLKFEPRLQSSIVKVWVELKAKKCMLYSDIYCKPSVVLYFRLSQALMLELQSGVLVQMLTLKGITPAFF